MMNMPGIFERSVLTPAEGRIRAGKRHEDVVAARINEMKPVAFEIPLVSRFLVGHTIQKAVIMEFVVQADFRKEVSYQ